MSNYDKKPANSQVINGVKTYNAAPEKFWTAARYDQKSAKLEAVKIEYRSYYHFLETQLGIHHLQLSSNRFLLVQVKDNVIEVISMIELVQLVKDELLKFNTEQGVDAYEMEILTEQYAKSIKQLHAKERMSLISVIEENFLRDTAEASFFCFLNCIVRVSKNGVEQMSYDELGNKYVWKSQIISRTFSDLLELEYTQSVFSQFISNVAGSVENYNYLRRIMGYLMHGYIDPANPKAVILQDLIMNGNPNGGTGKGLIIQAVRQMVGSLINIDGKQFKPDRFPFCQVQPDTVVVSIDDILSSFDFEFLFSTLTEGMSVEPKGKDTWRFPAQHSPKIVLTANTPVQGKGSSHARRRIEFGLQPYYNASFTPKDEFGVTFFHDFTDKDWLRFDNFMLHSMFLYFRNGLKASASSKQTELMTKIDCLEFAEFAPTIELNRVHMISALKSRFNGQFPNVLATQKVKNKKATDNQLTRIFREWVTVYAETMDYYVEHNTKRSSLVLNEKAKLEDVVAYLAKHQVAETGNNANKVFRKLTGLWCSDKDFEKFIKIAQRKSQS